MAVKWFNWHRFKFKFAVLSTRKLEASEQGFLHDSFNASSDSESDYFDSSKEISDSGEVIGVVLFAKPTASISLFASVVSVRLFLCIEDWGLLALSVFAFSRHCFSVLTLPNILKWKEHLAKYQLRKLRLVSDKCD